MRENYGKRMKKDLNRKNKRNSSSKKSFNIDFDFNKFLRVTSKTLATTWVVALVLFFIFLVLVAPAVFDILNVRNTVDATTHNINISAEEVAEARIAYSNKVQHYVECTNNMQNLNLLQKIQNSAISSVAGINIVINQNLVITVVELFEIAVAAFPLVVVATVKTKRFITTLKENKKIIKKLEPKAEVQLLGS